MATGTIRGGALPISEGGTGAISEAAARYQLGLNGQMSYFNIATSEAKTFTLARNGHYCFFMSGVDEPTRRILIASCRKTDGIVFMTQIYPGSSSDVVISSPTTDRITIANNSNSVLHAEVLTFTSSAGIPVEVTT